MGVTGRLRGFAARRARQLHPAVRARIARSLGSGGGAADHGLLSVVIPVHNVEPYLERCLASVVGQSYRNLEILVIDDGSTDRTMDIARDYARRDRRVRLLAQPRGGNGRARNVAIAAAQGSFLAFADGDDVVQPEAYRLMVESLVASGSDFSFGSYCRLRGGSRIPVKAADELHGKPRIGARLAEVPEAIHDVFLWNKVFRRDFWDRAVGEIPVDMRYEDQETIARAFLRARSFDVLEPLVYQWRLREDGSSITQGKHLIEDLRDRLQAAASVAALIEGEADAEVLAVWRRRLFGADLLPYLEQAVDADDRYRGLLAEGLGELAARPLLEQATDADVQARVLLDLARRGEWADLRRAVAARADQGTQTPYLIGADAVAGVLPFPVAAGIPDTLLRADPRVLAAEAGVTDVRDESDGLIVTGYAYVRGVDDSRYRPDLTVTWPGGTGGGRGAAARIRDAEIDLLSTDRTCSHADAGFTVRLPRPLPAELTVALDVAGRSVMTTVPLPAPAGKDYSTRVRAEARGQALTLHLPPGIPGDSFVLATARCALPASVVTRHEDGTARELAVVLARDSWGRTLPAPSGAYTLRSRTGPGQATAADPAVKIPASAALGLRSQLLETLRVRPYRTAAGTLAVALSAPLADEEAGGCHQLALRRSFGGSGNGRLSGLQPGVLFESYGGKSCTDSPRAISDFLAADGFDEPIYWSVTDCSVPVPDYAVPLIQGTREWFERLAGVGRLVNNNNFPWFFRKSPGQFYLQTWHGTPLKKIGLDVPGRNIALSYRELMAREAGYWDLLLAQNDWAADVLPRALGYTGPVLTAGYPRNDALVDDDGSTRERTRKLLGVGEGQQVLLYAPTWRDSARDGSGRSDWVGFLDVAEAGRRLGPGYVFLIRGHHNVAAQRRIEALPNAIDVTDYPEVNDLYLASDALVTDYSSAMFDYGVLGRPMFFLVPDLEVYRAERGLYLDTGSLPGPALGSTAELVAAVRAGGADSEARASFADTYAGPAGASAGAAARALTTRGPAAGKEA